MTNFEFYKDKLLRLKNKSFAGIGLLNGEPKDCNKLECDYCDIKDGNCSSGLLNWLFREYEPSKIEVDTPIFVSNDEVGWFRRYFAKYENGKVYAFQSGATSWSTSAPPVSWKYAKLKDVEE